MTPIHILLVEDNEGDILLTKEALEESKIVNTVSTVRNGKEAIQFVFKQGEFADRSSPDLILLDINLPLKSGHEVLKEIKGNSETTHIPIIILTTSSTKKDILMSYEHHANCYVTKPVEVNDFLNAIISIENFWFSIVQLPKQ